MKQIPLTQGKFAIVDDDMFDYLNQWKWCVSKMGHWCYATRSVRKNGKNKLILMHRQILKAKLGQIIDHKNHNSLDNRIENLRFCSNSQNFQNSVKRENCSSKYKGVTWCKRKNKWLSLITKPNTNSQSQYIGYFGSEIKAAKAYDKAAKKYFGEFANFNFK